LGAKGGGGGIGSSPARAASIFVANSCREALGACETSVGLAPGLRLPKPQVRLKGWRGPLPPRRITPPTVFADFVEAAVKRTVGRSAEAFIEEPRQPAEVFEPS
jgi:hypothetical protein